MIHSRKIGDLRITNIVEYFGPTHDPAATFPEFQPDMLRRKRDWLNEDHWFPDIGRLVIAIQIWLVQAGDNLILIDAGVGNGKSRTAARMHRLNTLVPLWMEAAGAPADKITHVVMTHLHGDHVGWNTTWDGERWVPTFPNARYYIPQEDFDYFRDLNTKQPRYDGGSFDDSVRPVVDAGMVEFVDQQKEIAECLRVVPAPGHTPGMLNYWVRSGAEEAVFCADIFHHPLQIEEQQLNSAFCVLPDAAKATRAEFLSRAAEARALVMPCHFGPPHCGYIEAAADGFRYRPASGPPYPA